MVPQMNSELCQVASALGLAPLLDVAGLLMHGASALSAMLGFPLGSARPSRPTKAVSADQLERQLAHLPRAERTPTRLLQMELQAERRRCQAVTRLHARAQEEGRRLERANQALQAPPCHSCIA